MTFSLKRYRDLLSYTPVHPCSAEMSTVGRESVRRAHITLQSFPRAGRSQGDLPVKRAMSLSVYLTITTHCYCGCVGSHSRVD